MRKHPVIGHQILRDIDYLEGESEIVLTHEERFDGSGYPRGLKGNEIPLGARLFAISDTLDAMVFDRPYRKALPYKEAEKEILHYAGTQFDPDVVSIFQQCSKDLADMVHLYHEYLLKEEKEIHLYDPVCTMRVETSSLFHSVYGSTTFYFCSQNCQKMFEKAPKRYVR